LAFPVTDDVEAGMMRRPVCTALQSTVAADEAARRRWDVVIAGAGPAGAVAARQLAIQGVSVLLVDKGAFPRWKVCGCCLNGATLGALEALGMGDLVRRLGACRLSRMRLAVGPTQATLPLPAGAALSREALDSALVREAIVAGAAFLSRTEAVLLPEADSVCTVRLRSGSAESTTVGRLAIAADGLGGTFLKMIDGMAPRVRSASPIGVGAVFDDAPELFTPGTIFMACGRGAYVGAVRLEDGRLDVAAALNRARLRRSSGIGPWLRETLEECRFPVPHGWAAADWRGTPPLTRFRSRMAHHRLFVVGDSAGYVEPFTGEGISWAIQGAVLLVPHVLDGLDRWNSDRPAKWDARYRRFFRARKKVCVLVREVLRHRTATRATVALLGRAPRLASRWMGEISTLDPEIMAIVEGRTR
jgi:flavin-dependent dehydrogenase